MNYTGISVGFGWTATANAMSGNRINNNDIHDIVKILADGGGIYTLSNQGSGSQMEYNYIHDFQKSQWADYGDHGLYLDEQTSGYTVSHNVLVNCPAISTNHPGTNTMSDNAGTLASTISAAGIEPAYADIKTNLIIPIPTFASSGGGASGACTNTGGAPGVGGTNAAGGSTGAGGSRNTGGIVGTDGATNAGGTSGTGGATNVGGTSGTGGATNVGGAANVGGTMGTGGATNAGGAMRAGGSTGSGGAAATSGATSTGGSIAADGLTSTGGAPVAGSSTSAGGATSLGGTGGVATSSSKPPGTAGSGCGCGLGGSTSGSQEFWGRHGLLLLGLAALGLHRFRARRPKRVQRRNSGRLEDLSCYSEECRTERI